MAELHGPLCLATFPIPYPPVQRQPQQAIASIVTFDRLPINDRTVRLAEPILTCRNQPRLHRLSGGALRWPMQCFARGTSAQLRSVTITPGIRACRHMTYDNILYIQTPFTLLASFDIPHNLPGAPLVHCSELAYLSSGSSPMTS